MPCKKDGMHEQKYESHSSENCFEKGSDQEYVNEDLVGSLGNRSADVNQYQKSEDK